MIRLRFPAGPPPATVVLSSSPAVSFSFTVATTNESGSTMLLAAPLPLHVRLVDPDHGSVAPLHDAYGLALKPAAPCAIQPTGSGELLLTLSLRAGAVVPAQGTRFRVEVVPAGAAKLVPPSGGGGSGGSSSSSKWTPSHDIPVAHVVTPVIIVLPRPSGAGAGAPSSAAATTPSPSDDAALQLIPFADTQVCVFERHMAISPGFGSIVWDCALVLGRVLQHEALLAAAVAPKAGGGGAASARSKGGAGAASPLRGLRIVDLGSGTGFVGLCAALLGADVLATDVPALLPIAELNARANAATIAAAGGSFTTAPLMWGEALSDPRDDVVEVVAPRVPLQRPLVVVAVGGGMAGGGAGGGTAAAAAGTPASGAAGGNNTRRRFALCPPYDAVLASEVAYRAELFAPLVSTMRALLTGGGAGDAGGGAGASGSTPSASTLREDRRRKGNPFVLLGARKRACCDIEDFLALLGEHFSVRKLFPTPAEAAGAGGAVAGAAAKEEKGARSSQQQQPQPRKDKGKGKGKEDGEDGAASRKGPGAAIDDFITNAGLMSKTLWHPAVYRLELNEEGADGTG
jgi:hypothetical protein